MASGTGGARLILDLDDEEVSRGGPVESDPHIPYRDDPATAWCALCCLDDGAEPDPEPGKLGGHRESLGGFEARAAMQRQGVEGAARRTHVVMLAA